MISPETLRRYPFFCCLNEEQQKAIAMITDEIRADTGSVLFTEGQPVTALYLLIEGSVDLLYAAGNKPNEEFLVGEVNVGEVFGISALIEPYTLTATARVASPSRLLRVQAPALRALCEVDCRMGYLLIKQVAAIALDRLHFTRVELAATRQTA